MSSDLETVLEIAQYLSVMLEIFEFNMTWEKNYQMHRSQVRKLIRDSHAYYVEFLMFLLFFSNTCARTRFSLNNIKLQLNIAKEELELDETTLLEIQHSSVQLSDSFEALHEQTKRTKQDLERLKRNLRAKKESIQEQRCGQYSSVIVHGLTAMARASFSVMNSTDASSLVGFLMFSGGAVATHMTTQNQKNVRVAKLDRLCDTVDSVQEKVVPLYTTVDECSQEIRDMRNKLEMLTESAKLNVRFEPDTDAKIRLRSDAMIITIDGLVLELGRVEAFIMNATRRLRAEIREVNPKALVNI